ncbi:hypothetical protein HK100_001485 [Physocladia obscura]|uniref:NmrA-like domain-containing protein n=1 Tax=Physocladia obscura TaxID=109957 RepID=A0AAD5XEH5_9FUNG|nr:hypothetical protein HK100_001485 [Physocladia obscura]
MVQIAIIPASSRSGVTCVEALLKQKEGNNIQIRQIVRRSEWTNTSALTETVLNTGADSGSAALEVAFADCNSALIVTPDGGAAFSDDAKLTENMLRAAASAGVKHIVLVGSWTVHHPEKLSELAERFLSPEKTLKELEASHGLKWTVLRGGYFMQNVLAYADGIRNDLDIPCAKCLFSPVNVENIGECAAVCLLEGPEKHHGKYYEMSGPDAISIDQIVQTMASAVGKRVNTPIVSAASLPLPNFFKQFFILGEETFPGCVTPFNNDVGDLIGTEKWTTYVQWVESNKAAWD